MLFDIRPALSLGALRCANDGDSHRALAASVDHTDPIGVAPVTALKANGPVGRSGNLKPWVRIPQ